MPKLKKKKDSIKLNGSILYFVYKKNEYYKRNSYFVSIVSKCSKDINK